MNPLDNPVTSRYFALNLFVNLVHEGITRGQILKPEDVYLLTLITKTSYVRFLEVSKNKMGKERFDQLMGVITLCMESAPLAEAFALHKISPDNLINIIVVVAYAIELGRTLGEDSLLNNLNH